MLKRNTTQIQFLSPVQTAKLSSKQVTNYFIENLKLVYLMLLRHSILQTNLETFHLKISNIRDERLPVEVPAYFSSLDTVPIVCHLDTLTPVTIEELSKIAPVVGSKLCTIDPIPASLLRENLDLLLPILCQIVNLFIARNSGHLSLPSIADTFRKQDGGNDS